LGWLGLGYQTAATEQACTLTPTHH
jgi:hypothetical protein